MQQESENPLEENLDDPQAYFTFILPVFNESERISRVINYYKKYGKIIVIDNFSTDDTLAKAKQLECEVVQFKNNGTIQDKIIFRKILDLSPTKYVAMLSSSEFIPPHTLEVFYNVAKSSSHNIIRNVIKTYTCGEDSPIHHISLRKFGKRVNRYVERFYNREALDYDSIFIHGPFKTKTNSDILTLPDDNKYNMIHVRDSDLMGLMHKSISYASVEAMQMKDFGLNPSIFKLSKLVLADIAKYIFLPSKSKNFIAAREVWVRLVMHVSIYIFLRELEENIGIEYSRKKSNDLWARLVNTKK